MFWRELNELMQGIPGNVRAMIVRDINGHVSNEWREYERIRGGHEFGEGNEAGETVLDFALSCSSQQLF